MSRKFYGTFTAKSSQSILITMKIRMIMISKNHVSGDLQLILISESKNMYDHDQHQQHLEDEGLIDHMKKNSKNSKYGLPTGGSLPVKKRIFKISGDLKNFY